VQEDSGRATHCHRLYLYEVVFKTRVYKYASCAFRPHIFPLGFISCSHCSFISSQQ
jgi:hypothetical protein